MYRRTVLLVVAALVAVSVTALASASPKTAVKHSGTAVKLTGTAVNNAYLPKGVTPCTDNWLMWGCDTTGDAYSQLTQINESNVSKLKVAWNEGFDGNTYNQAVESQPICCANGLMYTTTATGFAAVDPATGTVKWTYQGPTNEGPIFGLTAVTKEARSEAYNPVANLVYTGQQDGSVVALDAKTGALKWTVQVAGTGTYGSATHSETAPFTVYCGYSQCGKDGLIFTAPNGGESPIRGHLDAYDAKTGALVWRTWMTPDPTQLPFILTWSNPAEASVGGATVWSLPSVDPATGLLYYNTGNPYPYLGRQPGDDLWSDSVVALNLSNGHMRWFYQEVKHDLWDYDCPNPTVEYNAMVGGKLTPVVSAACKSAYVYLLSPSNGHPIYPIPQVAMSTQPGYTAAGAALNSTAATQPEPTGGEGQMIDHCPTAANASSPAPGRLPDRAGRHAGGSLVQLRGVQRQQLAREAVLHLEWDRLSAADVRSADKHAVLLRHAVDHDREESGVEYHQHDHHQLRARLADRDRG